MAFNLLAEAWIPVADAGGAVRRVRPAELIASADADVRVAWPRPDFAGATWEFLVGLVQCSSLMPDDDDAWRDLWEAPPSLAAVEAALAPLAAAFNLDGPGPRFLQDPLSADGTEKGLAALLIDSPGDNALTRNMDIFVKRGGAGRACPACAAMALYTIQAYAPSGGRGHLTSVRGGGPLTTLVLGDTPWQTVWANVLPRDTWPSAVDPAAPKPVFPWMGPLRLSEGKTAETRPGQVAELQAHWGQPRRYWLDFDTTESGTCALCGAESDRLVTRYFTRQYGVDYKGGWRHPLSPYNVPAGDPEGATALHGSPTGPDFRDWLGLVEAREDGPGGKGSRREPAAAVRHFRRVCRRQGLRLWAFGYDTDNMKARGWNDSRMPLYPDAARPKKVVHALERALGGLDFGLWAMNRTLRLLVVGEGGDAKTDFPTERGMVLDRTRPDFYALVEKLYRRDRDDPAEALNPEAVSPLLVDWHRRVAAEALRVFDEVAALAPWSAAGRVAAARRDLLHALWGAKMGKALELQGLVKKKKEVA